MNGDLSSSGLAPLGLDGIDDARFAAFLLMEASGLPVGQMWTALSPYLARRDARRRRPTWSDVHERLTDLLLGAAEYRDAGDVRRVLIVFQGRVPCRCRSV